MGRKVIFYILNIYLKINAMMQIAYFDYLNFHFYIIIEKYTGKQTSRESRKSNWLSLGLDPRNGIERENDIPLICF